MGFTSGSAKVQKKRPFHIKMQNSQPFAFAGLWERWQSRAGDIKAGDIKAGEIIETCTILTVEANELVFHTVAVYWLAPPTFNLYSTTD